MHQKANGAGSAPRRSATVNEWKSRLTFADQRRRRVDLRAGQIPAHAELQVMRGDVLEGHDMILTRADAILGYEFARDAVTKIDVAIAELERYVGRDLVG